MNTLDPRLKRLRTADTSLQQARNALQGAKLALADIPRSNTSPLTATLEAIDTALHQIETAAASLDNARLEMAED